MRLMTIRVVSAAALALVVSLSAAGAQAGGRASTAPPVAVAQNLPPADIPDAGGGDGSEDAGQLLVRIDHLETALRQANGQIEELQNNQRRLEDTLKKFQADVQFQLNNASAGGGAPPPAGPPPKAIKKSDAFDPNADPNAPGAPKQLGTTAPSAPLPKVAMAPAAVASPAPPAGPPMQLSKPAPADAPPTVITANTGLDFGDAPKQQYNDALDAYRAGQYDKAETGFKNVPSGEPVASPDGRRYVLPGRDLSAAFPPARGR